MNELSFVPQICFRVDASMVIGSGHVMRCLTLADALRELGAHCLFICREQIGDLIFLIKQRGYEVKKLNSKTTLTAIENQEKFIQEDIQQTLAVIGDKKVNWLIVDHYFLNEIWERSMREKFDQIMVIDDLANRSHDCDILLDQNLREHSFKRYQSLVPSHCQILTGPNHVLLGQQYKTMPLRQRDGTIQHILVYMGGNDTTNQAGNVLQALQLIPKIKATIVLGHSHPHRNALLNFIHVDNRFQVMDTCQDMAHEMNLADLAVGTCGIAAWERCALGLPSLVAISAENQREDALTLHKLGAVECLGNAENLVPTDWLRAIERHLSAPEKVREMGRVSQSIVAGHETNFRQLVNQIWSKHAH